MSWGSIKGHERWVDVFARVTEQNRLAHAYLFVGPSGIGKHRFALELAKTILCERREDRFEACGQCEACILFDARTHPDFFEVGMPEEKNEFPIELMRQLTQDFSFKPGRGRGKVAIVNDADELNDASANCFLKTLEEPPPRSMFILIGTSPDQQMATILSRCQLIRFAPLPEPIVRDVLTRSEVPAELIPKLLPLAAGSPGRALALADPSLWEFRQTLLDGLTRTPLDSVALGKAWAAFAEEAGKESAAQRRSASSMLGLLLDFLTQALALGTGGQPRVMEAKDREMLTRLTERASPEKILALLERALQTEVHLMRYVQVSLVLEALLDSFAQVLDTRLPARAG